MAQGDSQNRRNGRYLRLFTSFHPNMSVIYNKACHAPPVDGAVKPAIAKPANKQQPSRSLCTAPEAAAPRTWPGSGGGDQVPQHRDLQNKAGVQREEHGGYVYKPFQDCPTEGTVRDLLEWAVPTAEDHCEHGHDGQWRDKGPPAAIQDQEDFHAELTTTI
jgi:hypothetical protein